MLAAVEPDGVELVGAQVRRDAAVGRHRAAAVLRDERDDGARAAGDDRPAQLDASPLELAGGDAAGLVVGALADEAGRPAQLGDPRGDVRGLPARAEPRDGVRVGALRQRLLEADDDVEQQVSEGHDHAVYDPTMDDESRRSRTRSFLVGAALGASAALAAARRLRPKERRRVTPAGLAAFEEAPCYRELVERERAAP